MDWELIVTLVVVSVLLSLAGRSFARKRAAPPSSTRAALATGIPRLAPEWRRKLRNTSTYGTDTCFAADHRGRIRAEVHCLYPMSCAHEEVWVVSFPGKDPKDSVERFVERNPAEAWVEKRWLDILQGGEDGN